MLTMPSLSPPFLILLCLAKLTVQACGSGCIMCSLNNACLLCDWQQQYFLSKAGECKQLTPVENCQFSSFDGACFMCKAGHYLNEGTCLAVSQAQLATNCVQFVTDKVCIACKANYYLKEGLCVAVPYPIANCLEFSSDGYYCLGCLDSVPSNDFKTCVASALQNCYSYNVISCSQCASGYIFEPNYLASFVLRDNYASPNSVSLLSNAIGGKLRAERSVQCRKIQLANCATAAYSDQCLKCSVGYFLENGVCIAYPTPKIDHCSNYVSDVECADCEQGYWLYSKTACRPITPIDNCRLYSTQYDSTCQMCLGTYYLFNNQCHLRQTSASIKNCETLFYNRDLCQKCDSGYVLNLDYSFCYQEVVNCRSHAVAQSSVSCTACNPGFFLDQAGKCQRGSLANCEVYASSAKCQTCAQGFYLSADAASCLGHSLSTALSCQQFSAFQ